MSKSQQPIPSESQPVWVRETDDYMERSRDKEPGPPPVLAKPWVRDFLQPLIVGAMVACVALSLVQFVKQLQPEWNGAYLLVASVLAALAGHTTHRLARSLYRSAADRRRFQVIELLVMFLLLKIVTYLDHSVPEILMDVRAWLEDPLRFLDPETLVAFTLACAAWFSAAATARDMEALYDPTLYAGEILPMPRLTARFFVGGFVLLTFSGLTRIGIAMVLSLDHPRVPGLILNALVYFLLGLVMLGQLQFTRLVGAWERQKFKIAGELGPLWLRYSLILLGIALLAAFLLPTGYTMGLLDLIRLVMSVISYIFTLLLFLASLFLAWLVSLLTGKPRLEPDQMAQMPEIPTTPADEAAAGGLPWLSLLRSFLFWGVALVVVIYLLRSYFRDRADLFLSLKRFRFFRVLGAIWSALVRWWRSLRDSIGATGARVLLSLRRERSGKAGAEGARLLRAGGRSLRERVYDYYLTTLDRAREAGIPRQQTQTPYEYHAALAPHLSEAEQEMSRLTQGFVEARYSAHAIAAGDVKRLRASFQRVQDALRRLREQREAENAKPAPTEPARDREDREDTAG